MWENIVDPGRSQMTIWRKRVASMITRATDTHSAYVTLTAFPLDNSQANAHHCYVYVQCLSFYKHV